jgi:hypothetical protein
VREQQLWGGLVTRVTRVGDTVRRGRGPRAEFVQLVLEFFEHAGWDGAPRYLGVDLSGRDILGFIEGVVPFEPAELGRAGSDQCLATAARLMREFHDLTAGTTLAGTAEVVCHNDLSPDNTICLEAGQGLWPVAFLDWDLAAPGARIHDLAHLCWQFPGLGSRVTDVARASRQVRLICDSYRLNDRSDVIDTIVWWQERCLHGIDAGAAAGDRAMKRLQFSGAPASIRDQMQWVNHHRKQLEAALN